MKRLATALRSIPRAWFAILGGVIGAFNLWPGTVKMQPIGLFLPGLFAGVAVARLAMRHQTLTQGQINWLFAHRLAIAYIAFAITLAAIHLPA